MTDFPERLQEALKDLPGHTAQELMAPEHRLPHAQWESYFPRARKGAVLALFYPIEAAIHLALIQRPTYDGVHSGQVAFPGGGKEDFDLSMLETALRETEEEVGVPRERIQLLGQLTELYIPPSNFLITPVVGYTPQRPEFKIDVNEVVEMIEPSVDELLDKTMISTKKIKVRQDISIDAPYFNIRGRVVWGATAMMISELNEVLRRIM